MRRVELYTDGSCLSNPGPGGWAAVLKLDSYEKVISGGESNTTNNRMELLAVIMGLKQLKYACDVTVVTDSQYVVNAFNKGWVYTWEKKNFKNRPNADLWIELLKYVRIHKVQFKWIKGHAGHKYNEICDSEAQMQARRIECSQETDNK